MHFLNKICILFILYLSIFNYLPYNTSIQRTWNRISSVTKHLMSLRHLLTDLRHKSEIFKLTLACVYNVPYKRDQWKSLIYDVPLSIFLQLEKKFTSFYICYYICLLYLSILDPRQFEDLGTAIAVWSSI